MSMWDRVRRVCSKLAASLALILTLIYKHMLLKLHLDHEGSWTIHNYQPFSFNGSNLVSIVIRGVAPSNPYRCSALDPGRWQRGHGLCCVDNEPRLAGLPTVRLTGQAGCPAQLGPMALETC